MVISYRKKNEGFALPTVVIASLVLFAVLVATSSVVASTRVSLDTQFYESLATDAAESGGTHADSCMKDNELTSPWSAPTPRDLKPNTDCSGIEIAGRQAYMLSKPTYRTSYTVSPAQTADSGVQVSTVTGTVELLRQSTGVPWKTYQKKLMIKSGGLVGVNGIAFGYVIRQVAFFGSVGNDGVMRTVGFNQEGQLGNGTTNNITKPPTNFVVPAGKKVIAAYTSFLSLGHNMFAVTSDGEAYGAGTNDGGQIGDGGAGDGKTPSRVILPASAKPVRYIAVGQSSNYFLGNDGKVYSSGGCDKGRLGTGGPTTGWCAGQYTPTAVNLPAGAVATNKLVTDSDNAYVITTDGSLYGWGSNEFGQLGNGSYTNSSIPVKFGTFGGANPIKIVDVQFDGEAVYALGNNGIMYSAGLAVRGQSGSRTRQLYNPTQNACVTASGASIVLASCSGSAQQQFTMRADGTVYNAAANACMFDNGATVGLTTCNATAAGDVQQFYNWTNDMLAVNDKRFTATSPTSLALQPNGGYDASITTQLFYHSNSVPRAMDVTCLAGQKITKLSADQWSVSFMTDAGRVYSVGSNFGQFGNGSSWEMYNPECSEFKLPASALSAGVKAKDIYTTMSTQIDGGPEWQFDNLFVIGTDNRIYGAGSNYFGQLGLGTIDTANVVATPQVMQVINGTNIQAKSVKVGFGTTVILTTTNRVYTVGNNSHGQLGDGTTVSNPIPNLNRYTNEFRSVYY